MALYDPDPLLASIASFITLVGNFFAILFGTYDTDAFWTERYLSGNTEDYYWHIFCWSLDEYDWARAFCWIGFIVAVVALYFTVGSCRGSGRHAVERRGLESELEACRKGRIGDGVKIQDLDAEIKLLNKQKDGLEKKLADSEDRATKTAENYAQTIKNANDRADDFETQLDEALETNEQLEVKVGALERRDKTAQDYIAGLENTKDRLDKKIKDQDKDAEALGTQVGKLLVEKKDATTQHSRLQIDFVAEQRAKKEEGERATRAKAAETKATQEASTLRKDLRQLQRRSQDLEQKQTDAENAKMQYDNDVARLKEECTKKDAKVEAQTEDLRQKNLDLENLRNDLEKAKGQTESCRTELGDVKKEKTELQEHSDKATGDAAKQIEQLQQQNRTLQQEADTTRSQNKSLGEDLGKANTAAEQMEKLQQEHSTQGKTIDDLKVQNEALQNRIETLETKPDQHHDHAANLQDEIQEMESDNQSLRDELEQANPAVEQMTELQQNYHETEHETLQKTPNTPDQHHDNAAERAATNEAGTNTLLSNETTTASQAELADVQTRATQAEKAANDADNQTKAASVRYEDEQDQRAIPEHSITELETPRDQTEQQVAEHEGYYPQVPVEDEETFQTAVDMYENKSP